MAQTHNESKYKSSRGGGIEEHHRRGKYSKDRKVLNTNSTNELYTWCTKFSGGKKKQKGRIAEEEVEQSSDGENQTRLKRKEKMGRRESATGEQMPEKNKKLGTEGGPLNATVSLPGGVKKSGTFRSAGHLGPQECSGEHFKKKTGGVEPKKDKDGIRRLLGRNISKKH